MHCISCFTVIHIPRDGYIQPNYWSRKQGKPSEQYESVRSVLSGLDVFARFCRSEICQQVCVIISRLRRLVHNRNLCRRHRIGIWTFERRVR